MEVGGGGHLTQKTRICWKGGYPLGSEQRHDIAEHKYLTKHDALVNPTISTFHMIPLHVQFQIIIQPSSPSLPLQSAAPLLPHQYAPCPVEVIRHLALTNASLLRKWHRFPREFCLLFQPSKRPMMDSTRLVAESDQGHY